MDRLVLNFSYCGEDTKGKGDGSCIKAEVASVGLSQSSCGNGNSDLFKFLFAWMSGSPVPVSGSDSKSGTSIWVQDRIGNGYEANVSKGSMTIENHVVSVLHDVISVSPSMVTDGSVDLGEITGWIIDRIHIASWVGYVVDENGNNVAKPALSIAGDSIKLTPSAGVYGALSVKYELTRDKLSLGDGDGGFSGASVSFSVDSCPADELVDVPGDECSIDEDERGKWYDFGDVNGLDNMPGSDTGIDYGPGEPPTDSNEDVESKYDYCTRKLNSSDLPDPAPTFGGPCVEE